MSRSENGRTAPSNSRRPAAIACLLLGVLARLIWELSCTAYPESTVTRPAPQTCSPEPECKTHPVHRLEFLPPRQDKGMLPDFECFAVPIEVAPTVNPWRSFETPWALRATCSHSSPQGD